jgi:hypothetical protein
MLALDKLAICAIDTRTPGLALAAIERSMRAVRFARALLFLDDPKPWGARAAAAGIELVAIPEIDSLEAYSEFMLRGLADWIETDFALIVQWDGFVLNPDCWSEEFLEYDYIGALWPDEPPARAVGNGGFSMRSKRLLRAMSDPAMRITHPEDVCLCHTNRDRLESAHGIRFAPVELAARFAFECVPSRGRTFGFHGAFNLPAVLPAEEVASIVTAMTSRMARNPGTRHLALALVEAGQYATARRLFLKWARAGSHITEALSWWLRSYVYELKARFGRAR